MNSKKKFFTALVRLKFQHNIQLLLVILLIATGLSIPSPSCATEKKVRTKEKFDFVGYTFLIPKFVLSSTSGQFIDLINLIGKNENLNFEIKAYPPERTQRLFLSGDGDVFFPYLSHFNMPKMLISIPFYYKKDFLFYRPGQKILTDTTVCLTHGYPYKKEMIKDLNLKIVFNQSDEGCFTMLVNKRVDLVLCEEFSALDVIHSTSRLQFIEYDKTKPFSSTPVHFAFHDTPNGRQLYEKFNFQIKKLLENNQIQSLINGNVNP